MPGGTPDAGQLEDGGALPDEAYAAALASLPGIGPKALRALLADQTPPDAWRALREGACAEGSGPRWDRVVREARRVDVADVARVWGEHRRAGVQVLVLGGPGYPLALGEDPEAPAVLFALGDPLVLDSQPRVAIVGTRAATRYGLSIAAQLGADLAAVGVVVVSGLALGIDGAAHEGAVAAWRADPADPADGATTDEVRSAAEVPHSAPPVAVVAGSVTTPYPRQHAGLWGRVAQSGAVLSEAPIGSADLGWRFPLRNRIMAAMSDVVVVVECHERGGALHTVHAAAARGVPVGAVPGSVRSPASAGTNELLAEGCFVVRDASDVLVAVGLATASAVPVRPRVRRPARRTDGATGAAADAHVRDPYPHPAAEACGGDASAAVLDALGWEPTTLEDVLRHTGLPVDAAASSLEHLRARGLVEGVGGVWQRV